MGRAVFFMFGASGDLAMRKLWPALAELYLAGHMKEAKAFVALGREAISNADYREKVQQKLRETCPQGRQDQIAAFVKCIDYLLIDISNPDSFKILQSYIEEQNTSAIAYLALPPSLYGQVAAGLASLGNSRKCRLVLEKPIGHDLASSERINEEVARYFDEAQIYRIDHYLGKETVQNLLVLRFANPLFSRNWDNDVIDHVQITVAESVGVEGRWSYYDGAGQLCDMVQNHLLQILALVAMEPPNKLDADSIRDEKVKVLKALRPVNAHTVRGLAVRGQYSRGQIQGEVVPGYLDEEGAKTSSTTETFVALRVDIDNWRWANVPFYLRTGKRMREKRSEVVIVFKPQAHALFHEGQIPANPNKLRIRLQPHEGIECQMINKIPGLGTKLMLQESILNLSFNETFNMPRIPDAYERLLLAVFQGDQSLFVRRDEVKAAWAFIDSLKKAWQEDHTPLTRYAAGTMGSVESDRLLLAEGRDWEEV